MSIVIFIYLKLQMKALLSLKGLIGTFFVIFLVWQIYVFLLPAPRQLTYAEIGATEVTAEAFVKELTTFTKPGSAQRIGLAHLINDGSGQATEVLRRTLEAQPKWEVDSRSIPQAIVSDIFGSVLKASSLEEVARAGDRVALDLIIAGRVIEVAPTAGESARAQIELVAYDTVKGAQLVRGQFSGTWEPNLITKVQREIISAPLWGRGLIWLGTILLLPWITPFLTHWAHSKKTNAASSALLALYGGLAVLLAGFLMGFQLQGSSDWLILAGALILSTAWSYWSCERIMGSR